MFCSSCAGEVLADTQAWRDPLCSQCHEYLGQPSQEPKDGAQVLLAAQDLLTAAKMARFYLEGTMRSSTELAVILSDLNRAIRKAHGVKL